MSGRVHVHSRRWLGVGSTLAALAIFFAGTAFIVKVRTTGDKPVRLSSGASAWASPRLLHSLDNGGWLFDWSPDGRTLATSAGDGILRFWDVETGKMERYNQALPRMNGLDWSPDGKLIAVSSLASNTIRLLDASTGMVARSLTSPIPDSLPALSPRQHLPWKKYSFGEAILGWSKGGQQLVAYSLFGARDGDSADGRGEDRFSLRTVHVWDVSTGRLLQKIPVPDEALLGYLVQYTLSPDGSILAGAFHVPTNGGSPRSSSEPVSLMVMLWDVEKGTLIASSPKIELVSYRSAILDEPLAWSPKGDLLAAIADQNIALLSPKTAAILGTLPSVPLPTYTPSPFPTAGAPYPTPIPTQAGILPPPMQTQNMPGPARTEAPPGYTPPPTITPVPTPTADRNDYTSITGLSWSGDGRSLATYDSQYVRSWDTKSGELESISHHPSSYIAYYTLAKMDWSPDGSVIATLEYIGLDKKIRLWDPVTGLEAGKLEPDDPAAMFAWSPLGNVLLVQPMQGASPTLQLWGPAPETSPTAASDTNK